jgi:Ca2+:H+ antiporter
MKRFVPYLVPLAAWAIFFLHHHVDGWFLHVLLVGILLWTVLQAVHHAEVIAHRVGEPFGSLLLALAVTSIEASLIVSMMLSGGPAAKFLARDAVFSSVMIILNGMIGLSLLIGGIRHKEQTFIMQGVFSAMTVLVPMAVFTLIMPNFTYSTPGADFSRPQLIFVAISTFVLYLSFMVIQNFRHRSHFIGVVTEEDSGDGQERPTAGQTAIGAVLMLACLGGVVALAEGLAPELEQALDKAKAPRSLVGVVIAGIVLLPEGLSAFKAARQNKLQKSLNLSLGSALASIGLTIPVISMLAVFTGMPLVLGIDAKFIVLFLLSTLVIMMSFTTGKTTELQGIVLLVIFTLSLFLLIFP